jgi:hypothetical protein
MCLIVTDAHKLGSLPLFLSVVLGSIPIFCIVNPVVSGADPVKPFKHLGKGQRVVISHPAGNLLYGQVSLQQQAVAVLEPALKQVLLRGNAHLLFEDTGQVSPADPDRPGNIAHLDQGIIGADQEVDRILSGEDGKKLIQIPNLPPPPAQDSKRISGNSRISLSYRE